MRLRRRCADDDVVADVLQETYLAVWRAAGSYAGSAAVGSAVGWLWTIAANRLVDAFRRRARQERLPTVALVEETAPAAEDEVLANRVDQDLEVALLRLPPELRQVLQALALDDLSVRQTVVLFSMLERHGEDPGATGADRAAGGAVMTHPTIAVLARYAGGGRGLDDAALWSIEVHLDTCAVCRE